MASSVIPSVLLSSRVSPQISRVSVISPSLAVIEIVFIATKNVIRSESGMFQKIEQPDIPVVHSGQVRGDGKACYNRIRLFMTGSCRKISSATLSATAGWIKARIVYNIFISIISALPLTPAGGEATFF